MASRRLASALLLAQVAIATSVGAEPAEGQPGWPAKESPSDTPGAASPITPATRAEPESPSVLDQRLSALITPGGLTADQAAKLSARTSYNVAAAEAVLKAAQARVTQAGVGFVPTVNVTGSYVRQSEITPPVFGSGSQGSLVVSSVPAEPGKVNPIPQGTQLYAMELFSFPVLNNFYEGRVGVSVPLSDYVLRLSQSYAAASHSERAADLERKASILTAALNGRVTFYRWLQANAHLVVAEENVSLATSQLSEVEVAFKVGTASRADIMSVQAQVSAAELLLERARSAARVAEDALRVTLHQLPKGRPIQIGEDPRVGQKPFRGIENLENLRAEALRTRLEIRALAETAWAFTEEADAHRAGMFPTIQAFANGIYANPNQRFFPQEDEFKFTWDAGAALTWSPNGALIANAEAKQASARAAQTEAQKKLLKDAVHLEVTRSYQAFRESRLAIETSKTQLLAARAAYNVRRKLFARGRATSLEVTEDQHELTRARVNAVNAQIEHLTAYAELVHATGRDVKELGGLEPQAESHVNAKGGG